MRTDTYPHFDRSGDYIIIFVKLIGGGIYAACVHVLIIFVRAKSYASVESMFTVSKQSFIRRERL